MSGEVLFTDTDYLSEDEIADLLGISRFPFLLPEEAAERIGISRHKIMELARERKIHHYRFSPRVIRFDPVHMELLRDPTALRRAKRRDLMQPGEEGRLILTAFTAELGIRPWIGFATPDGWGHVWRPWLYVRCDASEIARRLAGGDE